MRKALALVLWLGVAAGWGASASEIAVAYLGHACFTIQAGDGPVIMIDPYASYVPFPALPQPADIVLMTHAHVDHCPSCQGELDRILGDPIELTPWDRFLRIQENDWSITDDLVVRSIAASHINARGRGSGTISLFSFEIEGIRFAHLGDLGPILEESQITALGDVDVLFIPVGGAYTIDPAEALTVIAQLPTARIVFPMHYGVSGITPWPSIAPLADFTQLAETVYTVVNLGESQVLIDPSTLPESVEVWLLDYLR